ncbi:MAG: LamG-like jellyroll fold domain-containing protein, partial [Terracidiphilus sp.]
MHQDARLKNFVVFPFTEILFDNGRESSSYTGLLDDVQFYAGVLDATEVAFLYANPGTSVPNVTGPSSGLAAYYDFDENTDLAADLSANGNNLIYAGSFSGPVLSTNAVSGGGADYFNGASFLTASSNLLSTLAGDFSLSLWVNTTQNFAWPTAPAYYGAGIVSADMPGLTNDLIPMALTGGGIGFNSGGTNDDTLNSVTNINDGLYHHVVVTRNQATGEKQIYIDGVLSTNDFATPGLLNAPKLITIGALADASNPDPASPEVS